MKRAMYWALGATALGATAQVEAHHAASGLYDRDGTITVTGSVESVFWHNPHVRFALSVPAADGRLERWEIEAGSVNSLERMGVSEDVLTPGNIIEVTGLPGRDGAPIAYARTIVDADGEQVSLFFTLTALDEHYELERDRSANATERAGDIFRVWVPVSVPNTGSGQYDFPLTDAARAVRAAWDPADDPGLRCEPPGMPAAMDNPYPIEFEDRGDTIVLRLEEWDGLRTIHMNPQTLNDAPAPTPMGHSIGRWEGSSLIVETDRISYPYFDDLGTPQSESIHITERFDLDSGNNTLTWTGVIEDQATFTEPVTLEIEWHWIPGNTIKAFDCALPD